MKKLLPALVALTLFCVHAQATLERPGRPAPAAEDRAPAKPATPVGAVWISSGADGERLEFKADGELLVDGNSMRYSLRGRKITIQAGERRIDATWRIEDEELVLEFASEGERTITRYRAERHDAPRTARAGAAHFLVPASWVEAGRDGDVVVLRPSDAAASAGFVLIAPFALEAGELRRSATELLRGRLPALRDGLAGDGFAVTIVGAPVRAARHPSLQAAEVRLDGRVGGAHPIAVWVSTLAGGNSGVAVMALAVPDEEATYVAAARRVVESLSFAPRETPQGNAGAPGLELAGLEFGRSTFGGGSSHTVVYRFGRGGALVRRSMFSSSIGGTDNESRGHYTVTGDRVVLVVDGERTEARLERRGADVTGLRIGNAVYPRL